MALQRLAPAERFSGTNLPGCTGVLHPWGRPLQFHPHLPSMVPGGGLSADRAAWLPSRANCWGPGKALSPISRAISQDSLHHAGLLEYSAPQVWTIPWHVHSQAHHHGPSACTSLAPSVCKGAIANPRLVSRQDRTVTCTSRKGGRVRLRTTHLDGREFLRRFRQPVLPHGFMNVRHCGCLPASGASPSATSRRMRGQGHPGEAQPPLRKSPPPHAARCPLCGAPMRVVLRVWTSPRAWVDTGGVLGGAPDQRGMTRDSTPMAPVRRHAGLRQYQTADAGSAIVFQRLTDNLAGGC
jgi:hypothetical protein